MPPDVLAVCHVEIECSIKSTKTPCERVRGSARVRGREHTPRWSDGVRASGPWVGVQKMTVDWPDGSGLMQRTGGALRADLGVQSLSPAGTALCARAARSRRGRQPGPCAGRRRAPARSSPLSARCFSRDDHHFHVVRDQLLHKGDRPPAHGGTRRAGCEVGGEIAPQSWAQATCAVLAVGRAPSELSAFSGCPAWGDRGHAARARIGVRQGAAAGCMHTHLAARHAHGVSTAVARKPLHVWSFFATGFWLFCWS